MSCDFFLGGQLDRMFALRRGGGGWLNKQIVVLICCMSLTDMRRREGGAIVSRTSYVIGSLLALLIPTLALSHPSSDPPLSAAANGCHVLQHLLLLLLRLQMCRVTKKVIPFLPSVFLPKKLHGVMQRVAQGSKEEASIHFLGILLPSSMEK